jgi:two-component system CheB/CheR fusion protein
LPASSAPTQTGVEPAAHRLPAKQPNDSRRILLVEDDAGVREATRLLLKAAGYAVATAISPAEARQKVDDGLRLDLVISDYHLGFAETGDQVIASLRSRLGTALKAILVTGDTSPALKTLGADQNVRVASKPVHPEQLLALLTELLDADP